MPRICSVRQRRDRCQHLRRHCFSVEHNLKRLISWVNVSWTFHGSWNFNDLLMKQFISSYFFSSDNFANDTSEHGILTVPCLYCNEYLELTKLSYIYSKQHCCVSATTSHDNSPKYIGVLFVFPLAKQAIGITVHLYLSLGSIPTRVKMASFVLQRTSFSQMTGRENKIKRGSFSDGWQ